MATSGGPTPSGATNSWEVEQQQQQVAKAAKVLAALEKQITDRIDKDFFAEETKFRQVMITLIGIQEPVGGPILIMPVASRSDPWCMSLMC